MELSKSYIKRLFNQHIDLDTDLTIFILIAEDRSIAKRYIDPLKVNGNRLRNCSQREIGSFLGEFFYSLSKEISLDRWTIVENLIKEDAIIATTYTIYSRKKRWIEIEDFIKEDTDAAYDYSVYVLKARWLEAEHSIKKDSRKALLYSVYVMKERWVEMEHLLKEHYFLWYEYCKFFNIPVK